MLFLSLTACQPGTTDVPYVSNVVVYTPLPGSNAAVAYLDLTNPGKQAVFLQEISSAQFAGVEMHATEVTEGIAKMRKIPKLVIAAEATQRFVPGGKHLMLLRPTIEPNAGSTVTLNLAFENGGKIVVDAVLQSRPVQ